MNPQLKIFTNGCFDIVHRGHIELLRYCSTLGQVIVGLNSDASVSRLKGPMRPINTENDRKFFLESIKYVHSVHIFPEDTPYNLIKELKPDLIIKGGDYRPEQVAGNDLCEVRIFKTIEGYSSSRVINALANKNF